MTQQAEITGASFKMGYRFQRYWDTPMALAFFCGELGAGLFLVGMLAGYAEGMIAGMLFTCIGKPVFHLTHMGVPARSWQAILRPDRSWISRGLIAIVVFAGAGGLIVLDALTGFLGPQADNLSLMLRIILYVTAALSAIVIMTYQGFAMAHSSALALWNSGLMPIIGLAYAMLAGITGAGFLYGLIGSSILPVEPAVVTSFAQYVPILAVGALVMIAGLLHAAWYGSPGGRQSAILLLKGKYAQSFIGLVLVIGLLLPIALHFALAESLFRDAVILASVLTGYLAFRILIFKAALFEPPLSLAEDILG